MPMPLSTKLVPAWFFLPLLVFLYRPLTRLLPGLDKDRYVRRVVALGNAFFSSRFVRTPYAQRMLFLPYCLRPRQCPAAIDPEHGLACAGPCGLECRLQEIRQKAIDLGYRGVHIVVSGRLHKHLGVLRSRDFLVRQLERDQPRAVIGCLCTRDLREKYLRPSNFAPDGTLGKHGIKVIPQVTLLADCNCRQSSVAWDELENMIESRA